MKTKELIALKAKVFDRAVFYFSFADSEKPATLKTSMALHAFATFHQSIIAELGPPMVGHRREELDRAAIELCITRLSEYLDKKCEPRWLVEWSVESLRKVLEGGGK